MQAHILRFTLLFFLLTKMVSLQSCKRSNHPVDGNANIWIDNVNYDPEYRSLTAVFGAMNFTGGVGGVLVLRVQASEGIDDFVAFDRACPYEASPDCKVKWDKNDPFYANCLCCKSKFNLINNSVESGPSEYPLYMYTCDYVGGNIHVY